jgi:hypothetical protein
MNPRSGAEHSPGRSPSRLDRGVKPTWRIYEYTWHARACPGVVPYGRASSPSATATASPDSSNAAHPVFAVPGTRARLFCLAGMRKRRASAKGRPS